MLQGLAVTLGWRPRGWVCPGDRVKLSISHWPLPQDRNPSPWLPWKRITFPLLSNQSPVWWILTPRGWAKLGSMATEKIVYEHRNLICPSAQCIFAQETGSWDLPMTTQLMRAGAGIPPRSVPQTPAELGCERTPIIAFWVPQRPRHPLRT